MSQLSYQVGTNANIITLEVQVGTAAGWGAFVFQPVPDSNPVKYKLLAQSSLSGLNTVFPKTTLGLSQNLEGTEAIIEVRADFRTVPAINGSDLQLKNSILFNALVIKFILDGGTDGQITFSYDATDTILFSTDGEIVSVQKTISFK